jgi:hypothetical protein
MQTDHPAVVSENTAAVEFQNTELWGVKRKPSSEVYCARAEVARWSPPDRGRRFDGVPLGAKTAYILVGRKPWSLA